MAMGGLLYISGDPDFPPCMPPETQSYYYASIFAAYECQFPWLMKKGKKILCPRDECPHQEAAASDAAVNE